MNNYFIINFIIILQTNEHIQVVWVMQRVLFYVLMIKTARCHSKSTFCHLGWERSKNEQRGEVVLCGRFCVHWHWLYKRKQPRIKVFRIKNKYYGLVIILFKKLNEYEYRCLHWEYSDFCVSKGGGKILWINNICMRGREICTWERGSKLAILLHCSCYCFVYYSHKR